MQHKHPIGVFDSGVGGTSIWKEIVHKLPQEDTIYLADIKNAPYGERSKEDILALSIKNTEYLISQGCKIIVVACNTATTNAIDVLRANYAIPFIGIEPALNLLPWLQKPKPSGYSPPKAHSPALCLLGLLVYTPQT